MFRFSIGEGIDEESFDLLDADTIHILLPKAGPRLKFTSKFKDYIQMKAPESQPETLSEKSTLLLQPSEMAFESTVISHINYLHSNPATLYHFYCQHSWLNLQTCDFVPLTIHDFSCSNYIPIASIQEINLYSNETTRVNTVFISTPPYYSTLPLPKLKRIAQNISRYSTDTSSHRLLTASNLSMQILYLNSGRLSLNDISNASIHIQTPNEDFTITLTSERFIDLTNPHLVQITDTYLHSNFVMLSRIANETLPVSKNQTSTTLAHIRIPGLKREGSGYQHSNNGKCNDTECIHLSTTIQRDINLPRKPLGLIQYGHHIKRTPLESGFIQVDYVIHPSNPANCSLVIFCSNTKPGLNIHHFRR
ncbi:hypothetical protein JTE90_008674 [Oedothorax gibbosus]|uniref:Uncharacterized protein n=1 Tax=Oedothorax gibbosus TaxID=931172 RepID=A0AAV6TZP0_9ARAC|nr:hypothetical protein JTE90_008674 [Oedothorax gibbosus]